MLPDSDKKKVDTSTQKTGTSVAGQLLSFLGGGAVGAIAYNAYHAMNATPQESSNPKPKM